MAHHQGYAHRFGDKVTQNHENNHLEKQDNFTSTPKKPINNALLSHKSREETQKTSALSHPTPLFSKSRSLSRFRTRAYTHSHALRALQTSSFFAFTLHRFLHSPKNQQIKCEPNSHFRVHIGEGKPHFAFTLNLLLINKIRESGEEVKTKNEKQRTRAHARKSPNLRMRKKEWGLFYHFQKNPVCRCKTNGMNRKCMAANTTMNGLRLPFGVVYAIFVDDNNANDAV